MIDVGDDKKPSTGFSDIVGQEDMKRALLAVAAHDGLNGLLIEGEKGTAKSTASRALTSLMPSQEVFEGCAYGCAPDAEGRMVCDDCRGYGAREVAERKPPFVTLPLGATRDRVVGTLSVSDALDGEAEFEPGLVGRAHRGILYVDEVNLLDDHLVDVILDVAAAGVNRVERDGVSVEHPADFTLIGTMNPEEGDLRPQLLDRFDIRVEAHGSDDIGERAEIVNRALEGGSEGTDGGDDDVSRRLAEAREAVGDVSLADGFVEEISETCLEAGVDGHRADIAAARASVALAALDGRRKVIESDVDEALRLSVPHRMRTDPFDRRPEPEEVLEDEGEDDGQEGEDGDDTEEEMEEGDDEGDEEGGGESPDGRGETEGEDGGEGAADEGSERADDEERGDDTEEGAPVLPGGSDHGVGEGRSPGISPSEAAEPDGLGRAEAPDGERGAAVRTERASPGDQVDAAASVRAAASRGSASVEERDLRNSVREGRARSLVVLAVDASASMRPAMRASKGVALDLLRESYEERDEVAFVTFSGDSADVVLPPTDSVSRAARHLKRLPSGDSTPLAEGIATAGEVVERADPGSAAVVIVTDGKPNSGESPISEARTAASRLSDSCSEAIVVDAGDGDGICDEISERCDGSLVPLSDLSPDILGSVSG